MPDRWERVSTRNPSEFGSSGSLQTLLETGFGLPAARFMKSEARLEKKDGFMDRLGEHGRSEERSSHSAIRPSYWPIKMGEVRREISKAIVGQVEVVDGVLTALLAGGHVLLEGDSG